MNNTDNDVNKMTRVQLSIPTKMVNALQKRMYPIGIFATGECIRYLIARFLEKERNKDVQMSNNED